MMKKFRPILLTAICCAVGAVSAQAGTLENLERERAIVLDAYLDQALKPAERQSKTQVSRTRLIDLERMVLRDKSLAGKNTPRVRKAFDNYDLTFLVHASTEANRSVLDHWLEQIGVSTHSLMNTRLGRR
tara:strand:+ start:804 stop:1193 length:390 start_codon:yes stop_codon:yes gene_type:complete